MNSEDGKDYTCQCLSGFTGENCTLAQLQGIYIHTLEIACVAIYPMPYYSSRFIIAFLSLTFHNNYSVYYTGGFMLKMEYWTIIF